MKKSNRKELNWEQTEKLVTLALEERNPFEIIQKELGLSEKEVLELAILNKKVRTVQSGADYLHTTKRTILKYALDLDMVLIDTDRNKLTE